MKSKLFLIVVFSAVLAFLLMPVIAIAQSIAVTNFFPGAADEKVRDVLGKYSLVKALLVPGTLVLVMAVRKWIGLIPDQLWPWITPFIGAGLDWVGTRVGFWTGSPEAGLAAGGLAVWFSQLGKQTREALKDGFSTSKSGDTNEANTPPK